MSKQNALPLYLYRYRSLVGQSKEWAKRSILDSEHYFSAPTSFNDPFDCRAVFRLDGTKDELIRHYEGVIARHVPHLSREQRRREARKRICNPSTDPRNPKNLIGMHQVYDDMVTSKIGVLCLSAKNNDILMWSHYGNSHTGICLAFYAIGNAIETSQPVRYRTQRPVINPLVQSHDEMLGHAIFTKSDHWAYEEEWRLLQYKRGAGLYKIPAKALVGVILGAQISDADRKEVLSWVDARTFPIAVYQAAVSTTKFELEIHELRRA